MKNYLLLILLTIISSIGFTQNLDFENWNSDTILHLTGYQSTVNDNPMYGGDAVMQSSDFVDGSYSIRLETIETIEGDTLFGYFANGDPDDLSGGVPTALSSIDSVIGYYKYNVPVGDTALFLCQTKFMGVLTGGNVFKIYGTQNTWTRFAYPISASSVDSVIVAGASSNAISGVGITPGSYILFDNIHLKSNSAGLDTIPNYSFENWTNYIWEDLDTWITPNPYLVGLPNMPVERTTDSYSGNYAALLKTIFVAPWNDTVSGYMSHGKWTLAGPVGGIEFSSQPDSVEFYYKLALSGLDTASAYFVFKKQGAPIAYNGEKLVQNQISYTKWSQAVSLSQVPDTLFMAFSSGNNPGSQFIIDKINFIYPVAVNENYNLRQVVAYPNPTFNDLYFRINSDNVNDIKIDVYSVIGKLVLSKEYKKISGNNELILNTSNLKQGNYIYKIKIGNDTYSKSFIKN